MKPGKAAPGFTLPRLDGGELSLDDYAGRRVLLVFSDPDCGPCDLLAPALERLSGTASDVSAVMVSLGDPDRNRRKAAEHRLSFPVVSAGLTLQSADWRFGRSRSAFVRVPAPVCRRAKPAVGPGTAPLP